MRQVAPGRLTSNMCRELFFFFLAAFVFPGQQGKQVVGYFNAGLDIIRTRAEKKKKIKESGELKELVNM